MAKSFLDRVSPSRARSKVIDWPFLVEGGETPKVRVRVLGFDKMEAANLEAVDHFAKLAGKGKSKVSHTEGVFLVRERVALVWHAFTTLEGEPLAYDVDELAQEADGVLSSLYEIWNSFQAEVTTRPMTAAQMTAFIDELKKNTHSEVLTALPSAWLIELLRGLASQLVASTQASELGS